MTDMCNKSSTGKIKKQSEMGSVKPRNANSNKTESKGNARNENCNRNNELISRLDKTEERINEIEVR